MSRTMKFFVLLLFCRLLCMGPMASTASSQDKHEPFWRLNQAVEDILAGKNVEQAKAAIGRGTRLVYGDRSENLKSVVAGEIEACSLADTSYHGVEIVAKTNPSEDMGFIMLKTRTFDNRVRFHTVVFEKDSTGEYRIESWHAGR